MQVHVSYAIEASPPLRRFIAQAEAGCRRAEPQAFWRMREAFDGILQPRLWQDVYLAAIEGAAARPTYDGGRDWHVSGLALYESDDWLLSLRNSNANDVGLPPAEAQAAQRNDLVSTRTAPAMLAVVSPHAETFSFYRLPADFDPDIHDPRYRIAHDRDEQVPAWQRVDVRADIETVELRPRAAARWSVLEFSLKPVCMQRWEFRKSSGMPVGTTLANTRSAALMAMLAELARARCVAALDEVASLLEHPDFNVRWAAARCLGKLDAGETRKALSRLCGDAHPAVASMASSALEALGVPSPGGRAG